MMQKNIHLFEVSWEVCNKVGGIYEVVASKARLADQAFNGEYILLGPDTKQNAEFTETDEPLWDVIRYPLKDKNIHCRFGRWEIPGRPHVILVDFKGRHDSNRLLHQLWERFGVDSLSGGWDYVEPVLFSYTCGEAIAIMHQVLSARDHTHGVAQFHEWMCGAGLLALKQLAPSIGTVFTTHATVLGRAMAGADVNIYARMREISPSQEADSYNVTAKCSMESVSARTADIFTTVSNITAEEARIFLGRAPDIITDNGLDIISIPDYSQDRTLALSHRRTVLRAASRLLRRDLPENTRILAISGRYEYHNKGVDLFLDALSSVQQALSRSQSHVLALMLMMGGHSGLNDAAVNGDPQVVADPQRPDVGFITSHYVYDAPHDPILTGCRRLGLENRKDDNVQVVFVPALLDGHDGFFNIPYFDILSGCDLGVFPSWYEPWGYTPQESAAYSVPTVTTDLSGFGLWVRELEERNGEQAGIGVISRHRNSYESTVEALANVIMEYVNCSDEELDRRRRTVREAASYTSWDNFFPFYAEAYAKANEKARQRRHANSEKGHELFNRSLALCPSAIPFLRRLNTVSEVPQELSQLLQLSRNLWWSWHPEAEELFRSIDPNLWERFGHNPVIMLDQAEPARLMELARDATYLGKLHKVMDALEAYLAQPCRELGETLNEEHPIAYFSTEYGIHESLPLYSGGLGVLSGDHLKSASDERLPLIGVGLFYLNGYFRQQLDANGHQIPLYPENSTTEMPLVAIRDENDAPLLLPVPLGARTLYVRIWKLQVGRVPLYLLDSNTTQNSEEDRGITARLYDADRDIRLRQEILLGMGGVRLLTALGITPSVWHMNEGHSAFLTLERVHQHMKGDDLSLNEAMVLVRSSCVFTTHTPVDAGNERFSVELMRRYFMSYAEKVGMDWQEFLHLGRQEGGDSGVFDMTVLALRLSSQANAVSAMHGVVARRMWRNIWKGLDDAEIPIDHVTNGVHVASYVGSSFRHLLERHVAPNWDDLHPDDPAWANVDNISDIEFQVARRVQKQSLIDALRVRLPRCSAYAKLTEQQQKVWLSRLNTETLVIGFARRFAPYKRATMLFGDPERLERLFANDDRPVVLIMAGKAHAADSKGIELIEEVVRWSLDPRFFGKVFFVEDYNLEVSHLLSRGCDVWLNTPRRPNEASGTSGEKVPVNGGINLSVSDGWWVEGDDGSNGWTIGAKASLDLSNVDQNDYADAEALYRLLEEQVIPLYFQHEQGGLSHGWLDMARRSLRTLTAQYSCRRMVRDYLEKIYLPTSRRGAAMDDEKQAAVRRVSAWMQSLPGRFNTAAIRSIEVQGLYGDTVVRGHPFTVELRLAPGDMGRDELLVQLIVGRSDGQRFLERPDVIPMVCSGETDGQLVYTATYTTQASAALAYGLRVVPHNEELDTPLCPGFVLWA